MLFVMVCEDENLIGGKTTTVAVDNLGHGWVEDPQVCYNFSSAVEPLLTDWAAGRSVRGLRTNISVAIKKRLADEIFAAHVTVVSDANAGPLDFCNDDILTAWDRYHRIWLQDMSGQLKEFVSLEEYRHYFSSFMV